MNWEYQWLNWNRNENQRKRFGNENLEHLNLTEQISNKHIAWSKQILKDVFNTFKDQIIMMKDLNLIHHLFVLIMISKAKQSKPLIRKYEYEILNIRFHLIQHHSIIQRTSQHHSRYKQITSAYNFIKIKLCNIKNI